MNLSYDLSGYLSHSVNQGDSKSADVGAIEASTYDQMMMINQIYCRIQAY
jgi:hypothetical protein